VTCKKRHQSCKRNGEGLRRKRKRAEEVVEGAEVVTGQRKRLQLHSDVFTFRVQDGRLEPRPADLAGALGRWMEELEKRQEGSERKVEERLERLERKWEEWEAGEEDPRSS
jgi:hypothetical protein